MSRGKQTFFDISQTELITLSGVEEIGPIYWNRIKTNFPNLSSFISCPVNKLARLLPERAIGALQDRTASVALPKDMQLITIEDEAYPSILKQLPDPPLWLYLLGDPKSLSKSSLSIVGSRKHTTYAKEAIDRLITKTIAKNLTIISGLAYGIDKLAHQKSLEHGGTTVAVLAGGLDKIYPPSHRQLAKEIINNGGAIISEYPPGSPAYAYRFPIRNRIIAGLSKATVVVEAAIKSGTMLTAKSALDYNRELLAVPGDISRVTSQGSNFLIHQGATPLISHNQLIELYGLKNDEGFDQVVPALVNLQSPQSGKSLDEYLSDDPQSIDQLAVRSGLSAEALMQQLTILELSGRIYQSRPGFYRTK